MAQFYGAKTAVIKQFELPYLSYQKRCGAGIDSGIIELIKSAGGDYIWIIGDDELTDHGLDNILNAIKASNNAEFIYSDPINTSTGLKHVRLENSRFFVDASEILEAVNTGLAFISSNVLSAKLAKKAIPKALKYKGTDFINFAITIDVIKNSKSRYFVAEASIKSKPHSNEELLKRKSQSQNIYNNFFDIFAVTLKEVILDNRTIFCEKTMNDFLRKNFSNTWRGVLVGTAMGWDTPKGKRLKIIKLYSSYNEAYLAIALFCLPLPIIKISYKLYSYFKKLKIVSKITK